jgi:hypothetical protein
MRRILAEGVDGRAGLGAVSMTVLDRSNIRIELAPNREFLVSLRELSDLTECGEKLRNKEQELPLDRIAHTSLEGV